MRSLSSRVLQVAKASMDPIPIYAKQYINGAWVESTTPGRYIDVIDPNNGSVYARVVDGTRADTEVSPPLSGSSFVP